MLGNILTAVKFKTEFLSCALLRGDTRSNFTPLGRTPFDMLLFTVFVNGPTKITAANLTNFGETFSKPLAFFELNSLSSCFISSSCCIW